MRPTLSLLALVVLAPAAMAQDVKPVQSKPVEPYTAKTIEPYHAKTIEPYHARTISADTSASVKRDTGKIIDHVDLPAPAGASHTAPVDPREFVGSWQLQVDGASYTTDNYATNTRTITTSSGAMGRRLLIRSNGTYNWGGIKGRWIATGESAGGYPLKLLKADGGADWKIGWDTRHGARPGQILVWNGYVWEIGRRTK